MFYLHEHYSTISQYFVHWASLLCGGKTRYEGFAREVSRDPLILADAGDHWKRMFRR